MSDATPQLLSYAKDFSELYARYDRLRSSLLHASGEVLEVAQALTEEELLQRLENSLLRVLPKVEPQVYVVRHGTLRRVSERETELPQKLSLEEAEELERQAEGSKLELTWILGRRKRVGLVAYEHVELSPDQGEVLSLVCRYAGLALENLTLADRRRSRQARSTSIQRARSRFLGQSPQIERVLKHAEKLAKHDSTILIEGETGVGKSLLARHIHDSSPRAKKPFVLLNCAAIPAQLVESELFGHEAGAFTGALRQRRGFVEQAEGGTLFMDEVGELPSDVQAKLLTFLEDRTYRRVGGESPIHASVRVISATNADLSAGVEAGTFRSDLLYRLRVFSLLLPPLRERGEDVLLMARGMLNQVADRYELASPSDLSPIVKERILSYSWPGNARELRNALERALVLSEGDELDPGLLPEPAGGATGADRGSPTPLPPAPSPPDTSVLEGVSFKEAKEAMIVEWEKAYLCALLERNYGNVSAAAREAGLDKRHVHRKIKLYEIDLDAIRRQVS